MRGALHRRGPDHAATKISCIRGSKRGASDKLIGADATRGGQEPTSWQFQASGGAALQSATAMFREGGSARARFETLPRGLLPMGSHRPPGCLLARSCAELVDLPPEGRKAAISEMSQQRKLLEGPLGEAIAVGELPRGTDVPALAWYFLGMMQAILDLPQAGATRSELDRMIAVAMLAWPATGIAGALAHTLPAMHS